MAKAQARAKNSPAVLPGNKKSTAATAARIWDIAKRITYSGSSRIDCLDFMKTEWGLSDTQASRYYYAALKLFIPEEPEKYREALINRNFSTVESILQKALDRNDLTNALGAAKILNQMLGVGRKAVEIKDKEGTPEERTITISFTD